MPPALAVAIWAAASLACLNTASAVHFDFETGDLQGWQVVEGEFEFLVCDKETFRNRPERAYNKKGRCFLTTLERYDGSGNDAMTGVIESPVFVLKDSEVSLLIGGGSHPDTYIALCDLDGNELLRASGKNAETMRRVVWTAEEWIGRGVFFRVVDRNQGSWGHITLDDVKAQGSIDRKATRQRAEGRETRRIDTLRTKLQTEMVSLRRAIEDLIEDFGDAYPRGHEFLVQLDTVGTRLGAKSIDKLDAVRADCDALRQEALLANPLLTRQPILFVVRRQYKPDHHNTATMFQNGEINTDSFEGGGGRQDHRLRKGRGIQHVDRRSRRRCARPRGKLGWAADRVLDAPG